MIIRVVDCNCLVGHDYVVAFTLQNLARSRCPAAVKYFLVSVSTVFLTSVHLVVTKEKELSELDGTEE